MSEVTTRPYCPSCSHIVAEPIAVYECGQCGQATDERRCAFCNLFTARADYDEGCPDCYSELDERDAVTDHDGTEILAEDYDPNGPSLAQRAADKSAALAAAAAAKTEATTHLLLASEITVGEVLHSTYQAPKVLQVWHPDPDTVVLVTAASLGRRAFAVHHATDQIRVHNDPAVADPIEEPRVIRSVGDHYDATIRVGLVTYTGPGGASARVLVLTGESQNRRTAHQVGAAVSAPGARELADQFDEMARQLTEAGAVDRPEVAALLSDDHPYFEEHLVPLSAWKPQGASSWNRAGVLNCCTGAFIDSPRLFTESAEIVRVLAASLPEF